MSQQQDSRSQSAVRQTFWNDDQRRLRAAWRLLLQFILFLAIAIATSIVLGMLDLFEYFLVATGIIYFISITVSIYIAGRFLDKRPFAAFGLHLDRRWWQQFAFGLLLGALLMSLIFVVELALGWVKIIDTWHVVAPETNEPFAVAFAGPLIAFIAVGFYEELFARGYILRNAAEGLHIGPFDKRQAVLLALLLSSIVFGLAHAGNPNATIVSTLNIALAGIFLGLGLIWTNELAIPIGLHISWNLVQGNVFGFPVSGTTTAGATVIQIEQSGPIWLTGGAFGPEAGVLGIAAMLLGMLLIWLYLRRQQGDVAVVRAIADYQRTPVVTAQADR